MGSETTRADTCSVFVSYDAAGTNRVWIYRYDHANPTAREMSTIAEVSLGLPLKNRQAGEITRRPAEKYNIRLCEITLTAKKAATKKEKDAIASFRMFPPIRVINSRILIYHRGADLYRAAKKLLTNLGRPAIFSLAL